MEGSASKKTRSSAALVFNIVKQCSVSRARYSQMYFPYSAGLQVENGSNRLETVVETPVFMPVGTQGTLKGITTEQLAKSGCRLCLGNTYHLGLRPGEERLTKLNGLHSFMRWPHALLTDSGGFQMVSLLKLSKMTEEGVEFQSPRDGSLMLLTPEKSMELQHAIGADIMMQLDDVVHTLTTGDRVKEAMWRSVRWLDRCIEAHKSREHCQNLFAIIQGGLDLELRTLCIQEMVKRDLPGYAIGGLSGGEDKEKFWRVVSHCVQQLPRNKPVYCMGVGYAIDLVVCSVLGVDMFDCVFPTRTARFGNALVPWGSMNLRKRDYASDMQPIDADCVCPTCTGGISRALLHSIVTHTTVACNYLTLHNIYYQMNLMKGIRQAIQEDRLPSHVQEFCARLYGRRVPGWVVRACASVNILIESDGEPASDDNSASEIQ